MLGMMSPVAAPQAANPSPAAAPTMPAGPAPLAPEKPGAAGAQASPPRGVPARTMMGMPAAAIDARPAVATVVEPGARPGKLLTEAASADPPSKHTVFGVDAETSGQSAREPAKSSAPAKGPAVNAPQHLTMLGVAPVVAPAPQGSKPVIPPQTQHTMLGAAPPVAVPRSERPMTPTSVPAGARGSARRDEGAPRSFTPVPGQPQPAANGPALSTDEVPGLARPRSGLTYAIIGAVAFTVVVLGALAAYLLTRGPDVSVRVVNTSMGDALEVDVPGSKPGARVRFAGEERPLVAGRATFALRADGLSIGENALAVSVVEAGGAVDTATVRLLVDYRVRADLAPLKENPPAVDVVVDARPGSTVTVDGTPVALDARGHGVKRYAVAPQPGNTFDLHAQYRVALAGVPAPVQGDVRVTLPVTSAEIDRPGFDVITDQPEVEIGGAVEPTAEVVVGKVPVPVKEGRFLHREALPQPGDYALSVVARAPGKAPRVISIKVKRVKDMTMAAASFTHDPALTYARIAQNPLIYRGQNVAFDGRVYNVEVQGGRSVLQILALDCPGGARCPLWVEYPQATDAEVDTWVRVLGTVSGEQQFRSKQGQVQTVPGVQARYVLKLAR